MRKETLRKTALATTFGVLEGAAIGSQFTLATGGLSLPVGAATGGVAALTAEIAGRAKKVTIDVKNPETGAPETMEVPFIEQWDQKLKNNLQTAGMPSAEDLTASEPAQDPAIA